MASHAHRRLRCATVPAHLAIAGALLAAATGCSGGPNEGADAAARGGWTGSGVNAVSWPVTGPGVTAVTGLRKDGVLETAVFNLADGKHLWSKPATMLGRLAGMGVQPPALAGTEGKPVVVAVEPSTKGGKRGAVVARDARSGAEIWTRPVHSTFGPVRCGSYVCVSDSTARSNAEFVALDPTTGNELWKMPGIAQVQWSDADRVALFRLAKQPSVEVRDVKTGRTMWSFPVRKAVGANVNVSGGWSFGVNGDTLVGYLGPYQKEAGKPLSSFGFFALRLSDGERLWARKRLLRLYPSANPSVALVTRQVKGRSGYGDFEQLDPTTGQTQVTVPTSTAPKTPWWVAFPADLSKLGFLSQNKPGAAYDLKSKQTIEAKGQQAWSFCKVSQSELKIKGTRGFYPLAPLCQYDLATGKRVSTKAAPPSWYTGAENGWRVWRDEAGALHGVHDAKGSFPGMFGPA